MNQKTFHAIFVSPSIDENHFDDSADKDSHPKRQKTSAQGYRARTRSNISDILHLNGKVTGRAIAYATVLVSNTVS